MLLLDASAVIEVIRRSEKGVGVKELIEKENAVCVGITISEITAWCYMHGFNAVDAVNELLNSLDDILEPSLTDWFQAGRINFEVNKNWKRGKRRISLVDCLLAAIAKENDLEVATLDRDFEKLGCKAKIL